MAFVSQFLRIAKPAALRYGEARFAKVVVGPARPWLDRWTADKTTERKRFEERLRSARRWRAPIRPFPSMCCEDGIRQVQGLDWQGLIAKNEATRRLCWPKASRAAVKRRDRCAVDGP